MRKAVLGVLLVLLFVSPGFTEASKEAPIEVQAQSLEANYKEGVLHFIGNVRVTKGDFHLESTEMRVYLKSQNNTNQIDWVEAMGGVKMRYGEKFGTSERALYYSDEGKVVLEGNALLWEKGNRIRGSRVTIFLREDRAVVESKPGEKVELLVTEKEGEGQFLPRP
jgi:lipopolysaccharide export system protein LptA